MAPARSPQRELEPSRSQVHCADLNYCTRCFWINLPPGAAVILVIALWVRPPYVSSGESILRRLRRMDWAGAVLLLASTTCLLMALQEGGVSKPWGSAQVIGLFVGFASMFAVFVVLQYFLGENASINLRLLATRTGCFTSIYNFTVGASYYSILYYGQSQPPQPHAELIHSHHILSVSAHLLPSRPWRERAQQRDQEHPHRRVRVGQRNPQRVVHHQGHQV